MNWKLNSMVAFNGKAWYITAITVDGEAGKKFYTLNNIGNQYKYLTVCQPI